MMMYHPYHLVSLSPWPLAAALGAFIMTSGMVIQFHLNLNNLFMYGILIILISSYQWWRDIIYESTYNGDHTNKVKMNMSWGMILFICSEVLFFVSFFWAYFYNMVVPNVEVGSIWPPKNIFSFNCEMIPLLNTFILLSSGVTATWSHMNLINNNKKMSILSMIMTVMLGILFTVLQGWEYMQAEFDISDSVYSSTFFIMTGFHGFHVIIGTMMLIISMMRLLKNHFSFYHHIGYELSLWYWHFVDVVWLFLFTFLYYLGN